MGEGKPDGLEFARNELRLIQAKWGDPPPGNVGIITDKALGYINRREAAEIVDGPYLREGIFKYDAQTERQRWDAARAIIRRTEPGPHEDANYLALIAREAASIEAFLRDTVGGPAAEVLDRVVVGTTGAPQSDGFTQRVGDDAAIIAMSAGMIGLLYETSKAIVLSWKQTPAPRGGQVSFSGLRDDVISVIEANPYPAQHLHDVLESWFYLGTVRPALSAEPPPEYQPPLQVITKGAERFIVAHEYGHAFKDIVGVLGPDGQRVREAAPGGPQQKELRADLLATAAVAESSERFDRLPVHFAFQGAIVTMKAHQIFERGLGIARHGQPYRDSGSPTHPPFVDRLRQLVEWYVQNRSNPADAERDLGPMRVPAETAELLWERVAPMLKAHFDAGRPMAAIWNQQA